MEFDPRETPEHNAPKPFYILRPHVIVPLILYFIFFRKVSNYVKRNFWLSFNGFKQYRLQNLSICWLHAVIVGIADLIVVFTHWTEMFDDVIHYWSPIVAQVPLISVSYFIHDALDMLSYEWSTYTVELLFHHVMTCIALATPSMTDRFLLATGWALLMEVNSIFLHARTILQLCGISKEFPNIFKWIIYINIGTFVIFRQFSQIFWCIWAAANLRDVHFFYQIIGFICPIIFGYINGLLFMRLLASDGFLSESLRIRFQTTRDKERND